MRRTAAVVVVAALAAGLAATLAAIAGPDPTQAAADGCVRNYIDQTQKKIPVWVYVGDHAAPADGPPPLPHRLEGVISSRYLPDLAVHPTEEDLPLVHRSYDFNFDVLPDAKYTGLMAGDSALHTGNFAGRGPSTGRVHVEREQAALPRFAWPEKGDRVELVGSWVWDCGHWTPGGERTEIHSYRALWVVRRGGRPSPLSPYGESEGDLFLSNDKTYAGVEADCAHKTKGSTVGFRICLATESEWQGVAGTYRFSLRVPPPPSSNARLIVRVVDARSSPGAPRPHVVVRGRSVDVSLTVAHSPPSKLVVAKRILARWTGAPAPQHLRVRFVRLLVRRGMDPGCPLGQPTCGSKETTHGEQVSTSPGEWNVYVDAAGVWATWGKGLLQARDGQVFRHGPTLDIYLGRHQSWRLFVFARECDWGSLGNADRPTHAMAPCPRSGEVGTFDGDDGPGVVIKHFRSPEASLGFHRARPLRRVLTTCPAVNKLGCYGLDYVVSRVGR